MLVMELLVLDEVIKVGLHDGRHDGCPSKKRHRVYSPSTHMCTKQIHIST